VSRRPKLIRLIGYGETAEALKLPSSAIAPLRKRDNNFPKTIHEQLGFPELRCGPIWVYDDVITYANERAERLGKK
jgi:hypothetical protein